MWGGLLTRATQEPRHLGAGHLTRYMCISYIYTSIDPPFKRALLFMVVFKFFIICVFWSKSGFQRAKTESKACKTKTEFLSDLFSFRGAPKIIAALPSLVSLANEIISF